MIQDKSHDVRAVLMAIVLFVLISSLAGCFFFPDNNKDGPPDRQVDLSQIKNPTPHYLPKSRYGNPKSYVVNGKRYHVLKTAAGYNKRGIASWYGTKFHGKLTSTREPYNMFAMTAASPELPIPSYARVTNLRNGRSIIVKVNDRGPFEDNRILDLSYAAAKKLGYENRGTAPVRVTSITFTKNRPYTPIYGDKPHYRHRPQRHFAKQNPARFLEKTHHPIRYNKQETKPFYLQVAAFSAKKPAKNLELKLQNMTAHHIRISHRVDLGSHLYKVQIGPIQNFMDTLSLKKSIRAAGYGDAIIVNG